MPTKKTTTTKKGTKPTQAKKSEAKQKAPTKGKRGAKAQAEAPIDANEGASAEVTAEAVAPAVEAGAKRKGKKAKTPKPRDGRLSQVDAALKVLAESGQPMSTKDMVEQMGAKGYWTSPGGRTPEATLYSAILRELKNKGDEARFVKTDRGRFALKG